MSSETLPKYDAQRTYAWNYEHAPEPPAGDVPPFPGTWSFCGLPVDSPLGIPAGPLLNGRWVLYYAALGFDVLTYKTVRSCARECYPLPNLQPVSVTTLTGIEDCVPLQPRMNGSWAVSFGMPSTEPDVWRADVEWTRTRLPSGKLLSVSVVGSIQPGWGISELAADYAQCARWAVESGADLVETNFSCPNVSTCDGQLFQQPADARVVAEAVREAVGRKPYVVKIGHVMERAAAERLLNAVDPFVDAIAMTNSVATRVSDPYGNLLFEGERRGICGAATREASLAQVRLFADVLADRVRRPALIGVGGVESAAHVRELLSAGAEAVHIATAAMVDPTVALRIRSDWIGAE